VQKHGIQVSVDRAQCIGNGICTVLAPAAFALDETVKACVLDPQAEAEVALLSAAESCPAQAIYLSVDGKPLYP
jgi:ferredoxin